MTQMTKNFDSREFNCKCSKCRHYQPEIIDLSFVETLQKIRDELGPMIITSGYRCREHNEIVGGSENSYHLRGWAVDVIAGDWPRRIKIIKLGLEHGLTVGLGRGFIHLDRRDNQIMFHY